MIRAGLAELTAFIAIAEPPGTRRAVSEITHRTSTVR